MEKKSNVAQQNRLTKVDGEVSKHTAGSITVFQHMFKMVNMISINLLFEFYTLINS